MKIAAIQHDICWEDRDATFARLRPLVAGAAGAGARLAVLTEMFSVGFSMDTARIAEPEDGPSAAFHDVGTPADYLRTAQTIAAQLGRPLDCGIGVQVDGSAQVLRSVLWNDVRVGAGAALTDCVVADGVVVPPGLRLSHAAVVRRDSQPPDGPGAVHGDLLAVPFATASR